jgi:uncharacterized membrane protein
MTTENLMLVARWLHILSATLAVGVPIYMWWVEVPALKSVDEPARSTLREALARRWRFIVYLIILIFLVTGFFNFLVVTRWENFSQDLKFRYHLYFGLKLLAALGIFFLLSALAGRSAKLERIRQRAGFWLLIVILLGVFVIVLSGTMRYMS